MDLQKEIHFLDEINFHPLQYYLVEEKRLHLIEEIHQLDMKIRQWNDELSTLTTKSLTEALMAGNGEFYQNFSMVENSKSKELISSMARGVQESVFKEPNYEINTTKEHVLEPNLAKNDVPCMTRGVQKPNFRESSHENNISMGDFHKPLMANMEKQPTLPNNYENLFGKSHIFKTNMVKNNEQAIVHEFKIFEIFQSVKKYEFSWSRYTMTFVVQNLFWICGSHQMLT